MTERQMDNFFFFLWII